MQIYKSALVLLIFTSYGVSSLANSLTKATSLEVLCKGEGFIEELRGSFRMLPTKRGILPTQGTLIITNSDGIASVTSVRGETFSYDGKNYVIKLRDFKNNPNLIESITLEISNPTNQPKQWLTFNGSNRHRPWEAPRQLLSCSFK